ncbi:NAD(P)/FAD-dependent oxidoreductase [Deinococcus sp.]|uniref:NAD(P)/FAD-dependent oxidoreductase n=1 Tax=Deinococcus sp. TaxID=47478 RepID=UPI003B5A8A96
MTLANATQTDVDVIVLGSGIGGSTVAAILARQGIRTAMVDAAVHPRFALGESTIGETTFLMRMLAARYDVPEIGLATTNRSLAEHVSQRCGIKRNFGFVYQREGLAHEPDEVTQCNVSDGPFGPESHLMRADVDQYLCEAAERHGCLVYEGVKVQDVAFDEAGVSVKLSGGSELRAAYVIDATGRNSVLAEKFALREEPSRFRTNSRTIFTHMTGVRPYDEVDPDTKQPTPWHEGTLHHLFDGGWMWVIPFNNRPESQTDLVSVGLNLDNARFPKREGISAEQEWAGFLASQPGIAGQFENAQIDFPWISTGRTQFSSTHTFGDRWMLMSHAAGAIDALFSRGMANTMAVIEAFVPRFMEAHAEQDYRAERFAYVNQLSQTLLDNTDKLVAGSYIAFRDFDLWRAWSKMWFLAWNLGGMRLTGAYYRYLETGDVEILNELHRGELPGTFAPEAPSAQAQFERCYAIMEAIDRGEMAIDDAIPEIAFILGDGEASPPPLNLHDVLRPWHDGSAETQTLIYNWGRTASPEGMRKWFDYDRATILAAAARINPSSASTVAAD